MSCLLFVLTQVVILLGKEVLIDLFLAHSAEDGADTLATDVEDVRRVIEQIIYLAVIGKFPDLY